MYELGLREENMYNTCLGGRLISNDDFDVLPQRRHIKPPRPATITFSFDFGVILLKVNINGRMLVLNPVAMASIFGDINDNLICQAYLLLFYAFVFINHPSKAQFR